MLFFLVAWLLVGMTPKLPNGIVFWFEAAGVAGLLAQAPEFHELAASAFMDGAASLALALPSPSSEINPDALAQMSFGFEAGVLLFYGGQMLESKNIVLLTTITRGLPNTSIPA